MRRRIPQQLASIGVLRRADQLCGRPRLLNLAVAEHHNAVRALGGQRQIVGNEQHGRAGLAAQRVEQVEHALLHRHVEGAGGLVGDNQIRTERQRTSDQHALLHAA